MIIKDTMDMAPQDHQRINKFVGLAQRKVDELGRMSGAVDNECSRYQFTYHPYKHPKGQWLTGFAKKFMEKGIRFIHAEIPRHFDKNAYLTQDPRLHMIRTRVRGFMETNAEIRKQELVFMAVDILIWICKEDIYWRNILIKFIDKWCTEYPSFNMWKDKKLYDLDPIEEDHFKMWKGW